MKLYLVILLLTVHTKVSANEFKDVKAWLVGTWKEVDERCPTTITFGVLDAITLSNENTISSGTYELEKAVFIGHDSVCRNIQCFGIEIDISSFEHRDGCASAFERGKHGQQSFGNLHRKSDDTLVFSENILFFRVD